MKKIIFIVLFLFTTYIAKPQDSGEQQIEATLKEFYSQYMMEMATAHPDNFKEHMRKSELLKEKYCTKKLLNSISRLSARYDCDPIIAAQDSREDCVPNLKFKKSNKKPNEYTVSYYYIDDYSKKKIMPTIELTVVKQNGMYKIDSIIGVNLIETKL